MDVKVTKGELDGLHIIEPEYFQDHRGFFFESYHKQRLAEHSIDIDFVQDNHSRSARNVVRGLHFQDMRAPQYRLVRCTQGEVWDVVVDLRVGSPTLGRWFGITLSADNKKQILMAPEFAHGFAVLSEVAEIQYKCSGHHDPAAEKGLAWNDPDLEIAWPVNEPVLSARDRTTGLSFQQYLRDPSFTC